MSEYESGKKYSILRKRPQGSWKWQIRVGWDTYLCLADTDNDPDGRRKEWMHIGESQDYGLCNIRSPNKSDYMQEIGTVLVLNHECKE